MWNWFNCYLSGRHEFGKWCESGAIFLRCVHCGRRSSGWNVHDWPKAGVACHPNAVAGKKAVAAPAPAARVAAISRRLAN